MKQFLRIVGGTSNGQEIPVTSSKISLGRGEEADYRLKSELVSRSHCEIQLLSEEVVITDLNSRNGTFVNGVRLEGKLSIKPGDSLRIGNMLFVLTERSAAGAEAKESSYSEAKYFSKFDSDHSSSETVSDQARQTLDATKILNKFFDREK